MADELKDQRIPIMMSPSEVKAIDDWMFENRIKSRAEAIRRLCQLGLASDKYFPPIHEALSEVSGLAADFTNKSRAHRETGRGDKFDIISKFALDVLNKLGGIMNVTTNLHGLSLFYKADSEDLKKPIWTVDEIIEVMEQIRKDRSEKDDLVLKK